MKSSPLKIAILALVTYVAACHAYNTRHGQTVTISPARVIAPLVLPSESIRTRPEDEPVGDGGYWKTSCDDLGKCSSSFVDGKPHVTS